MLDRYLQPDSVLRNAEFRSFLTANACYHFCSSSLTVMLAFHVFAVRNDPLDLAWLGFAQILPSFTVALFAGDMADRRHRRSLVVLTVALLGLLALALAALAAAGLASVPVLLVAGFLSACIRAFENPANVGLEAQVIPIGQFLQGVPMVATSSRITDMAGPMVMGFVWAQGGAQATYGTIGVVLLVAAGIFRFRIAQKPIPEQKGGGSIVTRIREGLAFVLGNQVLLGSMMLDLFAVFFAGAAALLPVFATDILDAGPEGFGLMRSAMAAGALAAAMAAIRFLPKDNAGLALHWIVAGFGLSMIVFALSTNFYLSLAMLFLAGLFDGMSMVIRHAILRLASPEHMRGRISAVRMVFVASSNELGAVQIGLSASLLGPVRAVVAGSLMTLVVVALVSQKMPALRKLSLRDS